MTPRLANVLAAVVLSAVAACGGTEREETTKDAPPGTLTAADSLQLARIVDSTLGAQTKREAATFPCRLFKTEEIAQLVGNPVDSGSYAFVNRTEDDKQWRSEACTWSTSDEKGGNVDVWVSLPKHFDAGQVTCHPLIGGKDQPSGLGKTAWWQFESWGRGVLRVCSDKALLEVQVTRREGDEAGMKRIARGVAEKILERS